MIENEMTVSVPLEVVKASEIEPKEVKWLWYPYIPVFCKTFLHKIAKTFCRSLQLHFVGNCKPGWQSWYLPAI